MKIRKHAESHIVELQDGSEWQIFAGDLDLTLGWQPLTELTAVNIQDPISSHALVSADGTLVRVRPTGHAWDQPTVREMLKNG